MYALLLVLLLPGCAWITDAHEAARLDMDGDGVPWPEDCDDADPELTALPWYVDADGDGWGDGSVEPAEGCEAPSGYVAEHGDCDDTDPEIHPGAAESCDGRDDDCNGVVDDDPGPQEAYPDTDGDGYGDPDAAAITVDACDAPDGYSMEGTDCDDTNPAVHPGADEFCDLVDQDCNGEARDDYAVDAATWYTDADGDGYGAAGSGATACDAPTGTVLDGTDCDDANPAVHPGAVEVCDEADTDEDCDGLADDADDGTDQATMTVFYADSDGDGYGGGSETSLRCDEAPGWVAGTGDCDDGNPAVHPGATEVCDEANVDEDCDGLSDDADPDVSSASKQPWYADADGDGYGGATGGSELRCDASSEHPTTDSSDCDDSDPAVNPGAQEVCDPEDRDEDCDGLSDDSDPSATGQTDWYADADGDGYGDGAAALSACDGGSGYADNAGDCDDSDAAVNPAAAETWYDGLDQDCDGASDFDADADGHDDLDHGGDDCDDTEPAVHPGAGETCSDGLDNDCDGTDNGCALSGDVAASSADARFTYVSSSDQAGTAVAGGGDLDGDGYGDLVIGAPWEASGGTRAGIAYVLFGPQSSTGLGSSGGMLVGEEPYDQAGHAVAIPGDVDGDGLADVLVGADGQGSAGSQAGAVYLVSGPASGSVDLSAAAAIQLGEAANDLAGWAVGGADLDGDGHADLLVGAYGQSDRSAGRVYVVNGPVAGLDSLSNADAILTGEASDDHAGSAVAALGDVDGDGLGDILVGARGNDSGGNSAGAAYLLLGPLSGSSSLSAADARYDGGAASDLAGECVAAAGDVDGDGHADLLVGAYGQDGAGSGAGAAYLLLGPASSSGSLASVADAVIEGEQKGDNAGRAIAGAGDVDGDGMDDLLIGAPGSDAGGSLSGAAYLLYGPVSGSVPLGSADMRFVGDGGFAGLAVAGPGDTNADGYADLLVGSDGNGAWLVLGSGL